MNIRHRYYELKSDRLEAIAMAAGLAYGLVEHYCLEQDWSEGAEHQRWLETAPLVEIADWVKVLHAEREPDSIF